jgi:uncharacterized protein (TIGR00369 family)
MTDQSRTDPVEGPHRISSYFRLERWEVPAPDPDSGLCEIGGRAPVDDHQRGAGGGLRTGALLTNVDSLGGFLSGLSVQPEWIVTTSMMATVARLAHRGPLRYHGRVLRRGRNTVVTALDVVDEGDGDRAVAAATMTCAVLDPGDMRIQPGTGPVTRLELADHLRNPWGMLHGGAVAVLADVAACRAAGGRSGGASRAAADTVLHYLRPARVGPIEARCQVLGGSPGRTVVRVAIHDVGAGDRLVTLGSTAVVAV